MAIKKIRLELGRVPEFPEGSPSRGYELTVPINEDGQLDEEIWRSHKNECTVRRFWNGEDDQDGQLIHTRHRTWAFSYEPGEDDDTPLFHLETHVLKLGEYITVKEHNGQSLPFKIVVVD